MKRKLSTEAQTKADKTKRESENSMEFQLILPFSFLSVYSSAFY